MNRQAILFSLSPIVECIFKHLNARDLCACAQVCQLWNRIALVEKSQRKDVQFFLKIGSHPDFEVLSHQLVADVNSDMETDLNDELAKMRIKPSFCIAFATYNLLDNFHYMFPSFDQPERKKMKLENGRNRKYLNLVIKTTVERHLPSRCPLTFIVASGVVGCNRFLQPVEVEDGLAIAGLILQDCPGVEIRHFPISSKKFDVNHLLPPDVHVKGLLMFLTSRGISFVNQFVQSCLLKEDSRLAVGGAIVDRTESLMGSVVAFCGDNVEAASLIINSQDRKDKITKKLEVFKDTGLLQNSKCFAFMFACVGRGYHCHHHHNLESTLFHALYPGVPLIGLFGSGEIGINYLPHEPVENKVIRMGLGFKRCIKKYLHSYTTVFVLVSIKSQS